MVSNPFEKQHVTELRNLDRFIGDTLEALRHQQNDLRRILTTLDDGNGNEGRSTSMYSRNSGPAPLHSQSRFTSSNLRNNQGYQQVSQAELLERERERDLQRDRKREQNLAGPPNTQSSRPNFDQWWDEMSKKKEQPQNPNNNNNAVRRPTHAAAAAPPGEKLRGANEDNEERSDELTTHDNA